MHSTYHILFKRCSSQDGMIAGPWTPTHHWFSGSLLHIGMLTHLPAPFLRCCPRNCNPLACIYRTASSQPVLCCAVLCSIVTYCVHFSAPASVLTWNTHSATPGVLDINLCHQHHAKRSAGYSIVPPHCTVLYCTAVYCTLLDCTSSALTLNTHSATPGV